MQTEHTEEGFVYVSLRRRFDDLAYSEKLRVLYAFERLSVRPLMHPQFTAWPEEQQRRWARHYNNMLSYACGGTSLPALRSHQPRQASVVGGAP